MTPVNSDSTNAVCGQCISRYIDGRVWPDRDELEVRLMMDLFKHVTGMLTSALNNGLAAF